MYYVFFSQRLNFIQVREEEMAVIRQTLILKGLTFTLAVAGYALMSLAGLLTFVGLGGILTPDVVCTFLYLFYISVKLIGLFRRSQHKLCWEF